MTGPSLALKLLLSLILLCRTSVAQVPIDRGDLPNPAPVPEFYGSTLSFIEKEVDQIAKGEVKIVATSPGGFPVYAVYYRDKENKHSQANYNSAVAARNPEYYARKDSSSKAVIFFLGPVHGQEMEGDLGILGAYFNDDGINMMHDDWISPPALEDETFPPKASFNLISALHHVSGTMAFTFECIHGTVTKTEPEPPVSYSSVLDIQLNLYDEMLDFLLEQ